MNGTFLVEKGGGNVSATTVGIESNVVFNENYENVVKLLKQRLSHKVCTISQQSAHINCNKDAVQIANYS